MTIDRHVGDRLRVIRSMHGLSPEVIAQALNVTVETLTLWEIGAQRVPARLLLELSQLLSVPLSQFFEGFRADTVTRDDRSERYVDAVFSRYSDLKH